MKGKFYKNIFLKIIFLFLKGIQIKCNENKIDNNKTKEERKEDEEFHPDMMKILEELKGEIQNINKDLAKYDTLIYILVPVSCLLFLILIGFAIYEIIKCCKAKKGELIETSTNRNYTHIDNNQNDYYQIKYFPDEQTCQNEEIQNTNLPSKFSNKSNPKVIFISNKYRVNNVIVEESNESVGLSADDYKQDDKKEKFITNKSEG